MILRWDIKFFGKILFKKSQISHTMIFNPNVPRET